MLTPLPSIASFPAPGPHPCGMAWDGVHLWISDGDHQRIYRLDPASGRTVDSIPCPGVKTGLMYDGARLWQVVRDPVRMVCLDPTDGAIQAEVPLPATGGSACGIDLAADRRSFWLGVEGPGALELRRMGDGTALRAMPVDPGIAGVAVAGELVWYTEHRQGLLVAADPCGGAAPARYRVHGRPTGLTWDGVRFWYADHAGRLIHACEPEEAPQ